MDNITGSSDQNVGMPQTPSTASSCQPDSMKATLLNIALWKAFHSIGTEMIITKQGRRMFPNFSISLTGLQPLANYIVMVDMAPADDFRYRWTKDQLQKAGKAEPPSLNRMYRHPDSPAQGRHWMNQPLSFLNMKLTNNNVEPNGHIVVHSMHRYLPRFHVIPADSLYTVCWDSQYTFTFPETAFTAVTAYLNPKITKLKIDNNPFAKGFREGGTPLELKRCGKTKKSYRETCKTGERQWQHCSSLQMMPSPSQLVQAENQVSLQESLKGRPPGWVVEGHSPEHIYTGTAKLQGYSGHEQMAPLSAMPQCFRHAEFAGFPPGYSRADGAHTFGHYPLSSVENVWTQQCFHYMADWGQYPLFS